MSQTSQAQFKSAQQTRDI